MNQNRVSQLLKTFETNIAICIFKLLQNDLENMTLEELRELWLQEKEKLERQRALAAQYNEAFFQYITVYLEYIKYKEHRRRN